MFPGRAAAKVIAAEQYAGTTVAWLVKDEVRVDAAFRMVISWLSRVKIAKIIKQVGTEASMCY